MNFLNNLEDWANWRSAAKFQVLSKLQLSKLLQLLNNQSSQDSSVSFFEKVNKGHLKMVNANY